MTSNGFILPSGAAAPAFRLNLSSLLLAAALGLTISLPATAGGQGGGGAIPGGKGGGWDNGGQGEGDFPAASHPGEVDLTPNTKRIYTSPIQGGDAATFTGRGNGGGAGAFIGGANADITLRTAIVGGMGGMSLPDDAGSGGGGDGLVVLDGTVRIDYNGVATGGRSNPSLSGSGGDGGTGLYLRNGALINNGQVFGGAGGENQSPPQSLALANGGNGGAGVYVYQGSVVNQGMIVGGNGASTATAGSRGGDGGDAVVIQNGAGRAGQPDLDNARASTIRGGNGTGVSLQLPQDPASTGRAGYGVMAGDNVYIRNQGTIRAGADGNGLRGIAVLMQGDGNRLELWNGSTVAGDVVSVGRNTLALGSVDGQPTTAAITGKLVLSPTSTYEVRATASGQADRLTLNNQAQLAGTVSVLAGTGTYIENTAYTILQAASLSGSFSSVTSNLAYLTPTVANAGNDVVLTLNRRTVPDTGTNPGEGSSSPGTGTPPATGANPGAGERPMRFEDAANNRNQRAVANAVEGMATSNPLYRNVLNLPVDTPASTFQALSGETHASAANTLTNTASVAAAVPLQHFRNSMNAALLAGAPTAAAGVSDSAPEASSLPQSAARPAWAQVIGSWQRSSATSETAGVRQHTGGLFMGVNHALSGGWRLGGAVGFTETKARADGLDSKADIGSYSLSLYGGKSFDAGPGKLKLLAGGAYTWHDLDTERQINAGGINQKLDANYGASTAQLFTELGYALPVNQTLTLEPFGAVTWSDQRIRAFSESGGYAALSGQSQRNDLTTTTLGLRAQQDLTLGSLNAALRGTLGWRHAFGDVQPRTNVAFDGSASFSVLGTPVARDAALVELSLDADLSRSTTLALGYSGQFGNGNRDQTGSVTLRWKF